MYRQNREELRVEAEIDYYLVDDFSWNAFTELLTNRKALYF